MAEYNPQPQEIVPGPFEAFVKPKPDIMGVLDLTREAKRLAVTAIEGGLDPETIVVESPPFDVVDADTREPLTQLEIIQKIKERSSYVASVRAQFIATTGGNS